MADIDDNTGEWFGPYRVGECLGVGGMATVHRATCRVADDVEREVALKRILPQLADDIELVEAFVREAKLASALQHPNIVRIFDLDKIDGVYFIAMEYLEGHDLLTLLRLAYGRVGPAPAGVAVSILSDVLDALTHASEGVDCFGDPLNLIHRDVTPSNVFVCDDGTVKLIDFGVAKALSGPLSTNSGRIKGKMNYLAPEVLNSEESDIRSDLYSAAVLTWETLTARRLFRHKQSLFGAMSERQNRIAPPSSLNPSCTARFDEVLRIALNPRPHDRWDSASAMRMAIEHVANELGDKSHRTEVAEWMRKVSASEEAPETPGEPQSSAAGRCPVHHFGLAEQAGVIDCECGDESTYDDYVLRRARADVDDLDAKVDNAGTVRIWNRS